MTLEHNGMCIGEGHSTVVMGNPVLSVKWLAEKLSQHGKTIRKGMLVSSGTFIPPVKLEEGLFTAAFSTGQKVSVHVTA
jgi:2-keto-4-pentenoate hydratase